MTEIAEWRGAVGDVWAREWRRTDRSSRELASALDAAILAAAPPEAFRAVDIGCGPGATSLAFAAARPDAEVIGVDVSAGLIAVACERGAARANARFILGDALDEARRFAPLDMIVSRHGVMFFPDPAAAFAELRSAAAPGARIVFSCFRDRALNPWAGEIAAAVLGCAPPPPDTEPGPFAFADRDHVTAILRAGGWGEITATPLDYAYRGGEGDDPVADAVDYFRRIGPAAPLLRAANPAELPLLLDRMAKVMRRYRTGNVIDFPAAAWIWSATV